MRYFSFERLAGLLLQACLIIIGYFGSGIYHLMANSHLVVLYAFAFLSDLATLVHETIEGTLGYREFCSALICFAIFFGGYVVYMRFVLFMLYCVSREGKLPAKLKEEIKKGSYHVVDKVYPADHKGDRNESSFANGSLVIGVREPPKCFVNVYVCLEEDGYIKSASPYLVGGGTRVGDHYITAFHCIEIAHANNARVFVSRVDSERCVEVKINYDLTNKHQSLDIAFLDGGNSFTLLGIQSADVGVFAPGMNTDVFTFDALEKRFHKTITPGHWFSDLGEEFRMYTQSNTRGNDSGFGVFQNRKLVAVHKGSNNKRMMNVHTILAPILKMQELRRLAGTCDPILSDVTMPLLEVPDSNGDFNESPWEIRFARKQAKWAKQAEEAWQEWERQQRAEEGDNGGYDWYEQFKMRQRQEAGLARTRMLGEHQDDQGYRKSELELEKEILGREGRLRDVLRSKGKSVVLWADEDEDESKLALTEAEKKKLLAPKTQTCGSDNEWTVMWDGELPVIPAKVNPQPVLKIQAPAPLGAQQVKTETAASERSENSTNLPKKGKESIVVSKSKQEEVPSVEQGSQKSSKSLKRRTKQKNLATKVKELEALLLKASAPKQE